jgi:hypothetical protein
MIGPQLDDDQSRRHDDRCGDTLTSRGNAMTIAATR